MSKVAPVSDVHAGAPARDQPLNRSRRYSFVTPATRMSLFRLDWPEAMVTEDRGTFKSLAKNTMQAWLARPSAGGLGKGIFMLGPSSAVTATFLGPGCPRLDEE